MQPGGGLEYYPVDGSVAFGPMPGRGQEPLVARLFDTVVAVVEPWELGYDPGRLRRLLRGSYVHEPVRDYWWPSLPRLARLARLVEEEADAGRRVLIHCRGGCGRSATVAAAYLMLRYRVSARHAAGLLRSIRPCSLENPGQLGILEALETALAVTEPRVVEEMEEDKASRAKPLLLLAHALLEAGGPASKREALAVAERGLHWGTDLDPGDAEQLARLELEPLGGPDYRLTAHIVTMGGYNDALEAWLEEQAERLSRNYLARVDVETLYD